MNSHTSSRFRRAYAELPVHIRRQAWRAYKLFQKDPNHPGLRFEQIHSSKPIYSVRVGLGYRALAIRDHDDLIWFWIGSHSDYDELTSRL